MPERLINNFPPTIYIATYDVCGYSQATGKEKATQKTGIVTHTNQLIDGFSQLNPSVDITVSQTGSPEEGSYNLTTPEGQTVHLKSIHAKPLELKDPETMQASPERIAFYYETDVYNPSNPIYASLAKQYATIIHQTDSPYLLLQNPNPLVSILKAEELDYISLDMCDQLRITAVIHDTGNDVAGYTKRFEYIRDRLQRTSMDVAFITISQPLYEYLLRQGIPEESITLVPNGINIEKFDERVKRAKALGIFACVRARDNLPQDKKLILSTPRRVLWKGHQVIINAAKILKARGKLTDAYVAFAGKNMVDAKSIDYEEKLEASIREAGLSDTVFLLDSVDADELAACYGEAYASLLASTRPEGLPYANFESMLAGAPVITSRLGGPLDYIEHGENGLFIEPNDPVDLANVVDRILSSPQLHAKIVENGRRTAEKYSLERMIQGYVRVMTRASKRRH